MRLAVAALLSVGVLTSQAARGAELKIGLIPEQNVFKQMERYQPIGDYLQRKTGIGIRFTVLSRYGNILNHFKTDELDGAFWGSFTGALAIKQLGVQPLVRPLWQDGTSTYLGYIIVRRDSGIRDVATMQGKVIAFVDRATTAGYAFPVSYLKTQGVVELESHFKELYFSGSHDGPVHDVLNGKADVGCTKNTIYKMMARADPRIERELVVLAQSPEVPSNALGMRPDLDPGIRAQLTEALLNMHQDPEGRAVLRAFGAQRFIVTSVIDYQPAIDMAREAGIDMVRYVYSSE